jgi:hypothetical protein
MGIKIGRIDIANEGSTMAMFMAAPGEGHIAAVVVVSTLASMEKYFLLILSLIQQREKSLSFDG